MKKAVIIASFWGQEKHIGNLRVDRFVRWLAEDGYHVCVVRAGSVDKRKETAFGVEITVRDPLGLHRDSGPDANGQGTVAVPLRKPNKWRRSLAYRLFCPDPEVVWGRRVVRSREVAEALAGVNFILSSSPPESAHLTAWKLSRKYNIPHIVDMRDGWIDEPLKPLLRTSSFRRWQEGRMERRILDDAINVYVTSDNWKELLCQRLPALLNKVHVLTNGYPIYVDSKGLTNEKTDKGILLVHAGRFLGSSLRRPPILLLKKLLNFVKKNNSDGDIFLIGNLEEEDLISIDKFEKKIMKYGWRVHKNGHQSKNDLFKSMKNANGFLLLSTTFPGIPGKLFEYILFKKPIFVVTERGSATWNLCKKLPQAFLFDIASDDDTENLEKFYQAITSKDFVGVAPEEYSEKYLSQVMLDAVRKL